jgi:hypothetical protein
MSRNVDRENSPAGPKRAVMRALYLCFALGANARGSLAPYRLEHGGAA